VVGHEEEEEGSRPNETHAASSLVYLPTFGAARVAELQIKAKVHRHQWKRWYVVEYERTGRSPGGTRPAVRLRSVDPAAAGGRRPPAGSELWVTPPVGGWLAPTGTRGARYAVSTRQSQPLPPAAHRVGLDSLASWLHKRSENR
jgi:hypothetical protein